MIARAPNVMEIFFGNLGLRRVPDRPAKDLLTALLRGTGTNSPSPCLWPSPAVWHTIRGISMSTERRAVLRRARQPAPA